MKVQLLVVIVLPAEERLGQDEPFATDEKRKAKRPGRDY